MEFRDIHGLHVLKEASVDYRTDSNEEKKDLEPHFSAVAQQPKITAKIFRVVMVKR